MTDSTPSRLVIASRESRLAMWQAEHIKALLQQLYPHCEVVIDGMTTRGDQILDRSLSKIGGKGLFIKELEHALLSGRCDLAVHSLKDVPMELEDDFVLAAMLEREDPRDAWVSNAAASLSELPIGAIVGTSSLRREAQLRALRPDIEVQPLRGNLDTRMAKLDRGDFQAIVLAAAGLKRLGLASRVRSYIETSACLPAPGQGTLGIEILSKRADLAHWLAPLTHAGSMAASLAERQVSRKLGGSCEIPLAAYADIEGETLFLRALVASNDGVRVIRAEARGSLHAAEALGDDVAQQLLAKGAAQLISR